MTLYVKCFRKILTVLGRMITYAKDVIVARPELMILIKDSMKAFQTEMIPKILFSRNKETLAGSLRVIATRLFQEGEKSHKG